jgi:predicted DCC family thiol-disulfide oxidoreductase YuxK
VTNAEDRPLGSGDGSHPLLLYDGVCGLCNWTVRFILRRDLDAAFQFASLQGSLAHGILRRHGTHPSDLDTAYVVVNFRTSELGGAGESQPDERLLARSDAVLFVMRQLGGVWRVGGWVLRLLPRAVRDWAYAAVARRRYRIFGRDNTCRLPDAETRARFLDL